MLIAFAVLLRLLPVRARHDRHPAPVGVKPDDTDFFFSFVTRPDIGAPRWEIEIYDQEALGEGYWFVAPYANLQQTSYPLWNGPHIYDQSGELIWSGAPMFEHRNIYDFRVSMVNGTAMLTGNFPRSQTEGDGVIIDHTYNIHKLVDMVGNNSGPNMHDFNLIDDGKRALFLTSQETEPTRVDLAWFNGTCQVGWQGFKEVDVETGELMFEWNDKGLISLDESTYTPKTTKTFSEECAKEWDITHFNAIDKFDNGDYLLSARHTDTLYKVSRDGSIVWRLGGVHSDFQVKDSRARFSRQHHARIHSQNDTHTLITVFDNAIGTGQVETASSGSSWGLFLALRTDVTPMTVDLVSRYEHPNWERTLWSLSRGSLQLLPNGNAYLGWVFQSLHSEYTSDGRLLMKANLRLRGTNSYRSYKFPWVGTPSQPPDVSSVAIQPALNSSAINTLVHVSWNGATEVATWNLLHTNFNGQFSELVASSPRTGFETQLRFDGFAKHVVAVALDRSGLELGRSDITITDVPRRLQSLNHAVKESQWVESARNQSLFWQAGSFESESSGWSTFRSSTLGTLVFIGGVSLALALIAWRRAGYWRGWPLRLRPGLMSFSFANRSKESPEHEWMLGDDDIK